MMPMIDVACLPAPRDIGDLVGFDRIGVFGASAAAQEVIALLGDYGKAVEFIFDNNAAKHGKMFYGRTVFPAAKAAEFAEQGGAIVIAAAYQAEIADQLVHDLSISPARVFPFVSRMFAGHFGRRAVEPHLHRIEKLIARVADDASRRYIADLVRFRWTMNPLDVRRNTLVKGFYRYDHPALGPFPGDHIVDCGAYTGDTAEAFLKRVGGNARVTAIEPLSRNFAELEAWIERNDIAAKVFPVHAAVASACGRVVIAAGDDPSDPRAHIQDGDGEPVEVETLDHLFAGRLRDVDYIKIDIEGFELDALNGASALLRASAPNLAIAGYHRAEHLWEIPELLDAIRPGYTIFVGHHPSAPYECEFFCSARKPTAAAV